MRLSRVLLALIAVDTLAVGLWATLQPHGLFVFVGAAPPNDAWAWQLFQGDGLAPPRDAGVWHLFGLLMLVQVGVVVAVGLDPARRRGLLLLPLSGRALGVVFGLWALGTTSTFPPHRIPLAEGAPLVALTVHEATAFVLVAAGLRTRFARAESSRTRPRG